MSSERLPLAMTGEGERVTVVAVIGGRALQKRLFDLGIVVGKELTVIQRQSEGPMVAAVGDARLALGLGVTHKILVTPVIDEVKR